MSYCLNPDCQKPQNLRGAELCRNCGAKLRLKDRYRPVKPIGQGGFGRTFLAIDEDKPSKPRCVVKQFLPSAQGTRYVKKAATLFEQEAIRLEELGNHPQIPALLAYLSQDDHQYLVQEYVDGKNLTEMLLEQGAFSEAQVRDVLIHLLPVLEFIHARSVIHRDVKPPNILCVSERTAPQILVSPGQPNWGELQQALSVETAQNFRDFAGTPYRFSELISLSLSQPPKDLSIADYTRWLQVATHFVNYSRLTFAQRQYLVADASRLVYEMRRRYEPINQQPLPGRLVLVDFGAAKSAIGSALMKTGTTIGSPEYIAPEQARGKAIFSSDLYSLGVTCAHLLTNTPPFDLFDTSENAWIWRRYLTSPISDRLGHILDKLLEPGVNRRYQSAAEVLQDLDVQSSVLAAQVPDFPPLMAEAPAVTPSQASQPPELSSSLSLVQIAVKPPEARRSPRSSPRQSANRPAARSTWQCVHQLVSSGKVFAIALSPTVPTLASSSGPTIRLWDVQTGQAIRTLTGHVDIVHSLLVSPDGKYLISGSADKSIRLWNLETGQRFGTLNLHTDTVLSLALSPSGQTLASGSLYDPVKLWDMVMNRELGGLSGHSGRVDTIIFSPDGTILAGSAADASIAIWGVKAGPDLRLLRGHTQQVVSLAFSPDGKTLASGSWDGTVKLWSTRTWREKRSLQLESGRVNAVVFTPDGKTLIIGSDTLTLWSPRTGKEMETLVGHSSGISAIVLTPDGKTLASSSWDGTIRIWRCSG